MIVRMVCLASNGKEAKLNVVGGEGEGGHCNFEVEGAGTFFKVGETYTVNFEAPAAPEAST